MLLKFNIENFLAFNKPVELNFEANLHTKKFLSNVVKNTQGSALKSLAIYGPNNTGKTCIVEALKAFHDVLLNQPLRFRANVFTESPVIMLSAEFLYEGTRYAYSFSYNTETEEFCEECFKRITIDQYGNRQETIYFLKNFGNGIYQCADDKLADIIRLSSKNSMLIYAFDTTGFPKLDEAKIALRALAGSMVVLSMDRISPVKTIEALKHPNTNEAKKIVSIIKAADVDIDDFMYSETIELRSDTEDGKDERLLKAFKNKEKLMDQIRLVSVHKGKKLPSIAFDSNGTKKIIALSSYLVDALDNGKILVLDELDSGLQFKLSRAIVSLFNSSVNTSAQLICTTHDVSLLDIKTLFRKEQIWFTDKDREQVYLYSLAEFKAEDGVRSDSDIYEKYSKGVFGSLPDPALVEAMLYGLEDDQ